MILSRNEVAAMLHKAARGQGMPLGHADDFVAAAVLALGVYEDFADQVTLALAGPHTCTQTRVAMAGPVAIDALLCGEEEIALPMLDSPELLSAMLCIAYDNRGLSAAIDVTKGGLVLRRSADFIHAEPVPGPLDIPDKEWAQWQIWAADTYVPATDQSRLSGAGAGLTDND